MLAPRALAVALILLGACSPASVCPDGPCPVEVRVTLTSGDARLVIRAEVAATPDEQRRGLMGRTSLEPDEGMLFVWPDAAPRSFWMKDTLIPLDLVSIRARRVVDVQRMQPCEADPCPLTRTPPADAALEVAAGTIASAGIEVGARVEAPGVLSD